MQCTSKEMTIFIQSLCLREKAILFSAERGIYRGKIFSEGAWSALCSHSCGAGNFTLQHRPQLQPYHSISINASKTLTHKVYRWEKHYFSGTRNGFFLCFFFCAPELWLLFSFQKSLYQILWRLFEWKTIGWVVAFSRSFSSMATQRNYYKNSLPAYLSLMIMANGTLINNGVHIYKQSL